MLLHVFGNDEYSEITPMEYANSKMKEQKYSWICFLDSPDATGLIYVRLVKHS